MTNSQKTERRRVVTSAIASVRAEGVEPSAATLQRFEQYIDGKIDVDELQRAGLAEAKALGTLKTQG